MQVEGKIVTEDPTRAASELLRADARGFLSTVLEIAGLLYIDGSLVVKVMQLRLRRQLLQRVTPIEA